MPPTPPPRDVLTVRNFAQIEEAEVEFGDLTVLVGPQATGKSLLLQWLNLVLDAHEVVKALKEAGHDVTRPKNLIDLVFGEGMSAAWNKDRMEVRWRGDRFLLGKGRRSQREGSVFYIPAHRSLLLVEGWPAPFLKLNADVPVVARLFSQNLYQRFSGRHAGPLFPFARQLKREYRDLIDEAMYHGGTVALDKRNLRFRLQMRFKDGTEIPFAAWTAGQREFTPLLLGLYHLLPPRRARKRKEIDWVIVEEPEMGLHPQAIAVVLLLLLDLLWRGYRVVVSTHSPLILDFVWAVRLLKKHGAGGRSLAKAFNAPSAQQVLKVMDTALGKEYRVYFMSLNRSQHAVVQDISGLDPEATSAGEAEWGGLTGFSSRVGEAVRNAVNEGATAE